MEALIPMAETDEINIEELQKRAHLLHANVKFKAEMGYADFEKLQLVFELHQKYWEARIALNEFRIEVEMARENPDPAHRFNVRAVQVREKLRAAYRHHELMAKAYEAAKAAAPDWADATMVELFQETLVDELDRLVHHCDHLPPLK